MIYYRKRLAEVVMNVEKNLTRIEFLNRENSITHLPYDREMQFFHSIQKGNIAEAKRLLMPFNTKDMGVLSEDSVRNLKYHLVITVAFLTRYCIEGGMPMETAYNLSDIYIRTIDRCHTEEEIHHLHKEVVDDFVTRMHQLHKNKLYSKVIITCLDYIHDNLHTKITLEDLASVAGLSTSYLSRLFHKEVGLPVSKYIIRKRVEAAENMLKFSEYSFIEISNYLGFSSESHFIQTFKEYTGYTPKVYRDAFFRTHWNLS